LNRKFLKFEIDLDFVLIAVTTSLKDYRICYLINKNLSFNFTKSADLEVDIQQSAGPVYFSLYQDIDDTELDSLVFSLNKIPEIVAAVKIDPKKLKSRENLLF
jgi:hypothetical protein